MFRLNHNLRMVYWAVRLIENSGIHKLVLTVVLKVMLLLNVVRLARLDQRVVSIQDWGTYRKDLVLESGRYR